MSENTPTQDEIDERPIRMHFTTEVRGVPVVSDCFFSADEWKKHTSREERESELEKGMHNMVDAIMECIRRKDLLAES